MNFNKHILPSNLSPRGHGIVRVLGMPYLFQKRNNNISLKIVALRWKKSFTLIRSDTENEL